MPKRIQRKQTKGWKMPKNCVSVTRPGMFGNPFKWQTAREFGYRGTDDELKAFAVSIYREWLTDPNSIHGHVNERTKLLIHLPELRGKDLACWCPLDKPCHADILLEIANQ